MCILCNEQRLHCSVIPCVFLGQAIRALYDKHTGSQAYSTYEIYRNITSTMSIRFGVAEFKPNAETNFTMLYTSIESQENYLA